jgi:hypothetical protein
VFVSGEGIDQGWRNTDGRDIALVHFCEFSGGHMVPSFASAAIWDFFDQF